MVVTDCFPAMKSRVPHLGEGAAGLEAVSRPRFMQGSSHFRTTKASNCDQALAVSSACGMAGNEAGHVASKEISEDRPHPLWSFNEANFFRHRVR